MKILKYKVDSCADLQSTNVQYAAGLTLLAIQFTPASGVQLFTILCSALRNNLMTDPSAPTFPWLSPNLTLDCDLPFLNLKLH